MPKLFSKKALIAALIATSFSISSCGPSRISQCNQLIAIINKGSAVIDAQKERSDVASNQVLARDLKAVAKQIVSLELQDERLQEYQTQFVGFFEELSQAFTEMGGALEVAVRVETNREGRRQLEEAQTKLEQAGKKASQTAEIQDKLINDLENYCQVK
jgi:hypothetical protein